MELNPILTYKSWYFVKWLIVNNKSLSTSRFKLQFPLNISSSNVQISAIP